MRKLDHCLARARSPETIPPICGPEAALAQMLCVEALRRVPIRTFDAAILKKEPFKNGSIVFLPGLEDAMRRGFESERLFSEMDLPWAADAVCVETPADER